MLKPNFQWLNKGAAVNSLTPPISYSTLYVSIFSSKSLVEYPQYIYLNGLTSGLEKEPTCNILICR